MDRAVKNKYGDQIALWTFLFMATSCGMFIASTAFLPSSFTMYCTMVAMAAWFDKKEWVSDNIKLCSSMISTFII